VATWWWNNFEDIITRFDTIHERDRQKDIRTDGQTPHDGRPSLCIASRGKKTIEMYKTTSVTVQTLYVSGCEDRKQ